MPPTTPPTSNPSMSPTTKPTATPSISPTQAATFTFVGNGVCRDADGNIYSGVYTQVSDYQTTASEEAENWCMEGTLDKSKLVGVMVRHAASSNTGNYWGCLIDDSNGPIDETNYNPSPSGTYEGNGVGVIQSVTGSTKYSCFRNVVSMQLFADILCLHS